MSSEYSQQFVEWFRQASPYIHAHRGKTVVISFVGEAVQSPYFGHLIHDIALLNSLGIRIVLVHGVRTQIDEELAIRGQKPNYANGLRITDEITLSCVKAACGEVSSVIESYLSMGLTNSPTADVRIRTASGNFITARPVGVRDGVDYIYTGEVRRIDTEAITRRLDEGCIVLIPPMGYSPTGEAFNLLTEDVATEVAIGLRAHKWVCLTEAEGIFDHEGSLVQQFTLLEAQRFLTTSTLSEHVKRQLANAIRACQKGVHRVHLVSDDVDGALLMELFSRDGIGTLISTDPFEHFRKATVDDVAGLIELIRPLEEAGILVRRSREKLEMEINHFTLQERDGMIIACAALYPFVEEDIAELACVAVRPIYQGSDRGDMLLAYAEREARRLGIRRIFVLTTHTAHWFQERGFVPANIDALPVARRALYNYQRNSKVFIKAL
ncbi:amino-acid N-acetyltransferase [Beggiatoa leptomitoformis]|uniref:Amino-acid acetyltransferase n=1 Tax=Beggiatoa leptomitoformis TaxID=288004 RepID=A0A2N9YEP9_9GAMM|nr:amino-acid N-acetyltransferase [Beggiatoa leptomitoformis]ALG68697.1 amino-acid N-acetyltransferase [Beggiatoa leptomitoformis]AUI68950.1 amino-acid N-acetyltransferase [Beggiatoa leptomitoformis]